MKNIIILIALLFCMASCDDFLDIEPTGKVIAKTAEEYREMLTEAYGQFPRTSGLATFRTDEFWMDKSVSSTEDIDAYFDIWSWNDDAPSDTRTEFEWRAFYHIIYVSNYIIEKQNEIVEGTKDEIRQLVGEAYCLRAYCHFQLANLYGEPYTHCNPDAAKAVPLSLKADVNAVLSRSSLKDIYAQVLSDLTEAERYLNVESWEEGLNYRCNVLTPKCLRARVYLYMGEYAKALEVCESILEKKNVLQDLQTGVLPNSYKSVENLLALEYVMPTDYQKAGRVAPSLFSLYKAGDLRKNKYFKQQTASVIMLLKGGSNEYRCSFRTSEFYLISAECAVRTGDMPKARERMHTLLNARYQAAQATQYSSEFDAMDKDAALNEVFNERARELAFEGHRWFDLRRMDIQSRPTITHTFKQSGNTVDTYTLTPDDARYTIRIPASAVSANPKLTE